MLAPNGTIVWDDYSLEFPGVVKALREFARTLPIFNVGCTRLAVYTRDKRASV
jgi:hypothetical protein